MRSVSLLAALSAVLLAASGCAGANDIDAGAGGGGGGTGQTEEPIFAPTQETFRSRIQPFMESSGCALAGSCHATSIGGGGYILVTDAPSASDVGANYEQSICDDRLSNYGTAPSGLLVAYFCSGPGTPNAGHNAKVATAEFCQSLYDWAAEGSGDAPPCQ